jgi:hypothetical protein
VRHLWRAGRTLFAILVGAVLPLAFASPAGAAIASTPAIAVQQGATCAYDTPAHVYDAPARLSSPDTVATDVRGSPPGLGDVSWGRSVSVARGVVAAESVATSERISSPLWTATKSDSAAANALRHFNDHGADFPGLNNSLEYVADAQSFLRSPPSGTLTRLRTNGDVVRYNPGSNTFGVMDSSGAPRTYFRPDPAQHGYPTNLDYFNAQ